MSNDKEPRLSIQPDRSKILMSDSLKGVFGEEDPFQEGEKLEDMLVVVALDRFIAGNRVDPICGSLVSFLLDESPEIEVRVSITDAFGIVRGMGETNHINELQLHHGEDVVSLEGPYEIEAMRMQDVNAGAQTCVLAMKLTKPHT